MIIDIGKGWVAVALLPAWHLMGEAASLVSLLWMQVVCALAVVVGHVYPLWFGFRGGKGAATLVGVVAGLAPAALIYVLGVWLAVLMLSFNRNP